MDHRLHGTAIGVYTEGDCTGITRYAHTHVLTLVDITPFCLTIVIIDRLRIVPSTQKYQTSMEIEN